MKNHHGSHKKQRTSSVPGLLHPSGGVPQPVPASAYGFVDKDGNFSPWESPFSKAAQLPKLDKSDRRLGYESVVPPKRGRDIDDTLARPGRVSRDSRVSDSSESSGDSGCSALQLPSHGSSDEADSSSDEDGSCSSQDSSCSARSDVAHPDADMGGRRVRPPEKRSDPPPASGDRVGDNKSGLKPDFRMSDRVRDDLERDMAQLGPVESRRFAATRLLLTYPQNPSDPQWVMDSLIKKLPHLKQACVSREKHKDGNLHLHAVIILSHSITVTRHLLNSTSIPPQGTHPLGVNIKRIGKSAADLTRTVRYVCKDGEYVCHPDSSWVEPFVNAEWKKMSTRKNVMEEMAVKLADGWTVCMLNEVYPGSVLQHLKKIEEYSVRVKNWKHMQVYPGVSDSLFNHDFLAFNPECQVVARWLMDNLGRGCNVHKLKDERFPVRPIRTPNLYITGPPGCGKSSFMQKMGAFVRIYHYPVQANDWHDRWVDWTYDVCWFDEFHGGTAIWFLNQFLSGADMPLNRRGTSEAIKTHNIPCVFAGNKSLPAIYHKAADENDISLHALVSRFARVHIPDGVNMMDMFKDSEAIIS